jgi:hypothetical protein
MLYKMFYAKTNNSDYMFVHNLLLCFIVTKNTNKKQTNKNKQKQTKTNKQKTKKQPPFFN